MDGCQAGINEIGFQVDWLDRLTFREIEMINEKEKRNSNYMYLMIEFPTVQIDGINVSMAREYEGKTLRKESC